MVSGEGIIGISVKEPGEVVLSLISITGARAVLYNGYVPADSPMFFRFNAESYVPGLYMMEMVKDGLRAVEKLIIRDYY